MMTSAQTQSTEYTRGEVALHKTPQDLWIIIDGKVYDVTNWLKRHPGGKRVIQHYGGEDATVSKLQKIINDIKLFVACL